MEHDDFSGRPEVPGSSAQRGSSRQLLLLVLLIFLALAGYLYFFTGLIRPREKAAPQPAPAAEAKKPLPPRPGQPAGEEEKKIALGATPAPPGVAQQGPPGAPPAAPSAPQGTAKPAAPAEQAPAPAVKPEAVKPAPPAPAQPAPAKPAPEQKLAAPTKAEGTKPPTAGSVKPAAPPASVPPPAAAGPAAAPAAKGQPPAAAVKPSEKPVPAPATAKAPASGQKAPAVPAAAKDKEKSAAGTERYALRFEEVGAAAVPGLKASLKKAGLAPVKSQEVSRVCSMQRLFVAQFTDHVKAAEELARLQKTTPGAFLLPVGNGYGLFAGSFAGEKLAQAEKKRLTDQGVQVTLQPAEVKIPLTRLTVGNFPSREEAEKAARRLSKGKVKAQVVKAGG